MRKYKIIISELNSKGKEQIIKCEIFNNRKDAENFISNENAEMKPYKIINKKPHYTMEGIYD